MNIAISLPSQLPIVRIKRILCDDWDPLDIQISWDTPDHYTIALSRSPEIL